MLKGNEELTERIIRCAIEVHRELGPGLLESLYEDALGIELQESGLSFVRQTELPVIYKQRTLAGKFRMDLLVEGLVVVELKCIEAILPVHEAQVLSYMKLGGWKTGLLLNFKTALMKQGIRRFSL